MKKNLSRCLLAAAITGLSITATADTTLRLAHLWPATSAVQKEIFETWAQSVQEASAGELQVEIYPSQTLSKSNKAYDAVVSGIADISVTLQGYTAGRFPLSEIVQLPGVARDAPQGACILQSLYDNGAIAQEYSDTHVLFMFTTGPGYLHTRDTDIQSPKDLEGLRIRRPSEVAGEMLSSMGAQPVGMPAPEIYSAMQRGVVDGLSFPWEAMKVFRINELANYHMQVPYYTGIIMATMNKGVYQSLSPEMKTVIDNNSGMKWAMTAGNVFNRLDEEGRQEAIDLGHTIRVMDDPLNDAQWSIPLREGTQNYLNTLQQRGLETAQDVYQSALDLRQKCAS
ncbi:TRAP transporter substrate-binding protein [Marinobacterium rhizophilum]|uniref:TRAP transporter substrate-binding protein n=1 Tax=Marinobacterium rhizophilum TaxID=420402 RepID=A0ABY5HIX1_9GAMM|nr:TRAP transporter substrate-binding protein [Marinobacterium rhizophilum]UTW12054.1 TRAP transporter substrate-binding protein [Marinobacterium rhizophilum]